MLHPGGRRIRHAALMQLFQFINRPAPSSALLFECLRGHLAVCHAIGAAVQVEEYLRDTAAPIWVNLSRERAELYREIQTLQHGDSNFLEQHFGRPGPFWGRQYLFWHGGKPLTVIHEVFSPALEEFLGPMQQCVNSCDQIAAV